MEERKNSIFLLALGIGIFVNCLITAFFWNKQSDDSILIDKIDSLQQKLNGIKNRNRVLLDSIIVNDTVLINYEKTYQEKFNNILTLGTDSQLLFFSEYVDRQQRRYFNNNNTDSVTGH